jgi:hypothetical protein
MRVVGTLAAVFIAGYGLMGVMRNDLEVSLSKSGPGVHLHGSLACLCCAGMLLMSIGLIRFLGPLPDDDGFDFDARRGRFGPMVLCGLILYALAQVMADP